MKAISINKFGNYKIPMQDANGYFYATAMCNIFGKDMAHYKSNDTTKAYLKALSSKLGIPSMELLKSKRGGWDPQTRGTWIHPKAAIHLAQWLSPEFAVFVTELVFDWQTGSIEPPKQARIEHKKPKKVYKARTLTERQIQEVKFKFLTATERGWPRSGIVRTVGEYVIALNLHFNVFTYTDILASDFDSAIEFIDNLHARRPLETQDIILRLFLGRENLTTCEKFERDLAQTAIHAMNLVRERPLTRGLLD